MDGGAVRLTSTQQAMLSLLARCRCDGAPYPSAKEIAAALGLDVSAVPTTLRRLERLGALNLAAPGRGREGRSYARRLTLVWDDERIELGGAEQLPLWRDYELRR